MCQKRIECLEFSRKMITKCLGRVSHARIMSPNFGSVSCLAHQNSITFGKSWDSCFFHHRQRFRISKIKRPEIRQELVGDSGHHPAIWGYPGVWTWFRNSFRSLDQHFPCGFDWFKHWTCAWYLTEIHRNSIKKWLHHITSTSEILRVPFQIIGQQWNLGCHQFWAHGKLLQSE